IRNIIIYHRRGKWFLEESRKFDSAALLFAYYMNNPIMLDKVSILLQRGVGFCRWEYTHRNLKLVKTVGRGAYGEVKLAELRKRNGKVLAVAVKTLSRKTGIKVSPKLIKEILKESRIMRRLRHPNIVSFIGVVLVDHPLYIILEYVQGGALDSYLRKNKDKITSEERMKLVMGVAWGMEYLHQNNIIHRDIAARNCLCDKTFSVKISDFGLSRKGSVYKMKTMQKMPIKYMAPESLSCFLFSPKTDVYTFGILVYEVYACKEPYQGCSTAEVRSMVIAGKVNKLPDNVPSDVASFVNDKVWNINPVNRPDSHQIVQFFEKKTGLNLPQSAFDDLLTDANTMEASRSEPQSAKAHETSTKTAILEVMEQSHEQNAPKPVFGALADLGNFQFCQLQC
ncbi:unnamed protein product, partial [Cylicocyclus nassatus]